MFAPGHIFSELAEHEERIRALSGFSKDDFNAFVAVLSLSLKIVDEAEVKKHMPEAKKVSADPEDAPYIAAALSVGGAVWTNDPHFKKQSSAKAHTTRELSKLLFS